MGQVSKQKLVIFSPFRKERISDIHEMNDNQSQLHEDSVAFFSDYFACLQVE